MIGAVVLLLRYPDTAEKLFLNKETELLTDEPDGQDPNPENQLNTQVKQIRYSYAGEFLAEFAAILERECIKLSDNV